MLWKLIGNTGPRVQASFIHQIAKELMWCAVLQLLSTRPPKPASAVSSCAAGTGQKAFDASRTDTNACERAADFAMRIVAGSAQGFQVLVGMASMPATFSAHVSCIQRRRPFQQQRCTLIPLTTGYCESGTSKVQAMSVASAPIGFCWLSGICNDPQHVWSMPGSLGPSPGDIAVHCGCKISTT